MCHVRREKAEEEKEKEEQETDKVVVAMAAAIILFSCSALQILTPSLQLCLLSWRSHWYKFSQIIGAPIQILFEAHDREGVVLTLLKESHGTVCMNRS